jgi:hypothetical protein
MSLQDFIEGKADSRHGVNIVERRSIGCKKALKRLPPPVSGKRDASFAR